MTFRYLIALPLAVLAAQTWAESSNMQPGLWEITTKMEMPGMPMQLPPNTMQHCYSAQDLAQAHNAVPQDESGNCRIEDYKLEGNTASWSIVCSGPNAMRGRATMTMEPTSYHGSMKSSMQGPAGNMQMTTHWRGRRIGDCR